MGVATLGNHRFRIDPTSIRWDYTIKAREIQTVGGKVVQIFGANLGDMTVTGTFGTGGWQEQARFLAAMEAIGDRQAKNTTADPIHFRYPPKGWDFLVYLTAYAQPGASKSVRLSPEITAPQWRLTLLIVEDNSGLKQVAMDAFLARLAEGIGWKQTIYNGSMTMDEMSKVTGGQTGEYLLKQAGIQRIE